MMVFSAVLFAQPSEPTVKEIDALFEKAEALMRTFSYRGVTVWHSYETSDLAPSYESTTIREFVPPNKTRIVSRTQSASDSETEMIYIGGDQYIKSQKGIWKHGGPDPPKGFVVSSLPTSWLFSVDKRRSKTVTNARHIANEILDGSPSDFYEISETKYLDGEIEETSVSRTWFSIKGTLLKTVFEKYSSDGKLERRITTSYEYDPNIRIEAPIP
jgi:hypothetical protein